MANSSLSLWQKNGIAGVGNVALLEQPLTAFFASRRCSGWAIRAACELFVECLMRIGKMRTQHIVSGEK